MILPPLVLVSGMPATRLSDSFTSSLARSGRWSAVRRCATSVVFPVAGMPADRAESQALGARTMTALFELAGAFLDRGVGIVFECNFKRRLSDAELAPLLAVSRAVNVHCEVPFELVEARIRARAAGRHGAHFDVDAISESAPVTWSLVHTLDLGIPRLVVDTTDGYAPDLGAIVAWVEENISC